MQPTTYILCVWLQLPNIFVSSTGILQNLTILFIRIFVPPFLPTLSKIWNSSLVSSNATVPGLLSAHFLIRHKFWLDKRIPRLPFHCEAYYLTFVRGVICVIEKFCMYVFWLEQSYGLQNEQYTRSDKTRLSRIFIVRSIYSVSGSPYTECRIKAIGFEVVVEAEVTKPWAFAVLNPRYSCCKCIKCQK